VKKHWFYILLSLAERERHGSGIVRDVLELTANELRLWPVTLYGSLDELREKNWIREVDGARADPPTEAGHTRSYRITADGRRALTAEVKRLREVVDTAQRRLSPRGEA
jgi:DNA-binding PadR family transcriptional regulator